MLPATPIRNGGALGVGGDGHYRVGGNGSRFVAALAEIECRDAYDENNEESDNPFHRNCRMASRYLL